QILSLSLEMFSNKFLNCSSSLSASSFDSFPSSVSCCTFTINFSSVVSSSVSFSCSLSLSFFFSFFFFFFFFFFLFSFSFFSFFFFFLFFIFLYIFFFSFNRIYIIYIR